MEESAHSKGSGSEDEPLVPDDFDEQFYKDLLSKIPEVWFKFFRVIIKI